MMVSVFGSKDERKNWKGYNFILHIGEFVNNPNKEMHIHVVGENGSMKVRLNPIERDESQKTSFRDKEERKIIKFVKENITDIK